MSVVRSFIAIELAPEIYRRLDEVIAQLQQKLAGVPVRWVPAKNIHLTLKFLGDVSLSNLEILKKIVRTEVSAHAPFEISVGELGAFPTIRRPRVIWVGVKAPAELSVIQQRIDAETARLGYAREDRKFSPHLTLGRVSRNATPQDVHKIGEILSASKVGFLGAVSVRDIHLFRSDLMPDGAVYTPLDSAPLRR
jgi:2'-5' RNA ligase